MNFKKQVSVTYQNTPMLDGEGFLFEVTPSDLPYGVYGKDCVQIAQITNAKVASKEPAEAQRAITYCRKNGGELVAESARNKELYDTLRTVVPTVRPDGRVLIGYRDATDVSELFPIIRGVAVKDANLAQVVAQLFEKRGYEITKEYR